MEPNISIETLKQTINTVNTITPLLIAGITGLFTVVTALAAYIMWQQKLVVKLQKESTIAISANANSNEHLVEVIKDLKMVVVTRRK